MRQASRCHDPWPRHGRYQRIQLTDLLAASASGLDAISYHHYGMLSERCTGASMPDGALSEQWLARTDQTLDFYRRLRDHFEPGKPIWLTETAEAACGGNRLAATFLDTFRYLDQLGRLAKAGVQVVMHNTLAASDYGLLDEKTLDAATKLLGRPAVAAPDGRNRARLRRSNSRGPSHLCSLPPRKPERRQPSRHQHRPHYAARTDPRQCFGALYAGRHER